jgi:hypothetical protein
MRMDRAGAQNIRLLLKGNENQSSTVVAAIAAARTILPLSLVASAKPEAVEESHFGDVGHHHKDHSESG